MGGGRVVVIGAGLGGLRTAEALRGAGHTGPITLIGDEQHAPYDRPPLSKQVLAGTWDEQRATLRDGAALAALDLDLRLGIRATGADTRVVELADGTRLEHDVLVVATGVRPRPLPGQPEHPRVHLLRTLDDCRALRAGLAGARSLVVVGGGFIGAEVAATARATGLDVTIVEALDQPLERVLGAEMGALCARLHRDNGVTVHTGAGVEALAADGDGVTVGLAAAAAGRGPGGELRGDQVVVGLGTVPDTGWLAGLGADPAGGLPCDTRGLVDGTTNVYAVGDVAAWRHPVTGERRRDEHWTSAGEQAVVVARRITGAEITREAGALPYFWSDQYGLKLQLVGRADPEGTVRVLHDPGVIKGTVAGWFRDGLLVGALAFHAPRLLNRYRQLVLTGADERAVRRTTAELTG